MRLLEFIAKAIEIFIKQSSFDRYHSRSLYALASKISYGSHRQQVLQVNSQGDLVILPMSEQEARTQSKFVFRHVKAAHLAIVKTYAGMKDRYVLLNNLISMLAAVVVQGPLHCTSEHRDAIRKEAEAFFKKNGLIFSNLKDDQKNALLKHMKFAQDNDRKIVFSHVISSYRQYLSDNIHQNPKFIRIIDHIDKLMTSSTHTIQSLTVFDKSFIEKIRHIPPLSFKNFIADISDDSYTVAVETKLSVYPRSYSMFGGKYPLDNLRAVIEDIGRSAVSHQPHSNVNASCSSNLCIRR
ncbi:MAG: hypothetical protein CL816_01375 [Coxiellaceae bacterium]|nr:hypothetical protein [Coxiellaceae bacterium]|tara:strand:+ start:2607 stop:3494 length:888 start_codon:yes stop_codon:yes gene_type:complete